MKPGVFRARSPRFPLLPVPFASETVFVDAADSVTVLLPPDLPRLIGENDKVAAGQPLCEKNECGTFSPVHGIVSRVMPWDGGSRGRFAAVVIRRAPGEEFMKLSEPVQDLEALSPGQIRERADLYGFHFPEKPVPVLCQGLDEDIDRISNRWHLEREFETVVSGLGLLRHMCGSSGIYVAVPWSMDSAKKNRIAPHGTVIAVREKYPDTLSACICGTHAALADAGKVQVIGTARLVELVTSLRTGIAPVDMLVSLRIGRTGSFRLCRTPIGIGAGRLLDACGLFARDGMQIVLGGEMTGSAANGTGQPLTPRDDAVLVLSRTEAAVPENNSCVNCGRCSRACPAGLRVDLIGKCIEFSKHDEALRLGIRNCIDCGMCSAVCVARRPLAHLCASGKKALSPKGKMDER